MPDNPQQTQKSAALPLSYEPTGRRYRRLIREGITSIYGAVLGLFVAVGSMISALMILVWVRPLTMLLVVLVGVIAAAGAWAFWHAAICAVDAIVMIGGREPPAWRWYRVFGRSRHT